VGFRVLHNRQHGPPTKPINPAQLGFRAVRIGGATRAPDYGLLGVKPCPIQQVNLDDIQAELVKYCQAKELELNIHVMEDGIICSPSNPYLVALINTLRNLSGLEPAIGRKLPGTSARFAPNGQGVVWGQTGMGPHSSGERHFIPGILPY